MAQPREAGRSRTRWSSWIAGAAFAGAASFLACGGDGPTAPPGLDLAQSTLFVAAGPYVAGQAFPTTFTARDENGDAYTQALTVTIALTGGTSAGTFSPVVGAAGVYSTTFTATTAGTPSTVSLTVNGDPFTGPAITVVPGPVSATVSTVAVGATSVPKFDSTTVTVTSRDALGNARPAGEVIALGKGAGTGDGSFGPVSDLGGGVYRAYFRATTVGSARTITALISGVAVTSTLPAIAVTLPPPSLSLSTVGVGSANVTSGAQTTVMLTLRDAAGAPLPLTGRTVVFTKGSGSSDGTFGTVADNGNGTYSATFTATAAGTARAIGATLDGAPITSLPPTITVTPGAPSLATSTVTVSNATIASGATSSLTLMLRDAASNRITVGGHAVTFTKGTGTSDGTISAVTDALDGTYTATFTGTVAGTARSIGATIDGNVVTSAAPTITVQAGALSLATTTLTASATTLVAGTQATLTVTARDAAGNRITTGGATVAIVKGTGTADGTVSAVADSGNGIYTATFSATTAGTARTLSATVGGQPLTSGTVAIAVTPGAASAATSTLALGRDSLFIGDTSSATVTTRDALGNLITTGGANVAFTLGAGSGGGSFGGAVDLGDGRYRALFTAAAPTGARTLNATIGGVALAGPVTVTVLGIPPSLSLSTVTVGASSVASGTGTSLTLTVRDANGTQFATGGLPVAFSLGAGTSTGTLSGITDHGDGTYSATFTGVLVGTARAVSASINGQALTSAAPTVTVTPGAVSTVTSTVSVGAGSILSGGQTTVTLTTRDAAGNLLTAGGLAVVFTKGAGSSDGDLTVANDLGNGQYTATFTGTTAGSARTIGATIGGIAVSSALPAVTVTPGAASLALSTVSVDAATVASGASTTLRVTTRDAAGNPLASGGLAVLFTKGAGASDGTISATTDAGDGTYSATFTGTTAGSARTIGATIGGNAITSTSPTITVTAGAASPQQSLVTVDSATLESGHATTVRLTARDAAGNLVTTGGATILFTLGGGTSTGGFGAVTDDGDGTYTTTFTGILAGTPRTIGATIGGVAVSTTLPTVTVTPGAASTATSTVAVGASPVASGAQTTLTLTTRDAAGNLLTTGGLTVAFTKGAGTSDGDISAAADLGNGQYTATFTGTTAGTARTIGATIGGVAVTSSPPTVTVTPGSASLATSSVTVDAGSVISGAATTVRLTARDAAGNALTSGGLTVLFTKGAGTSDGTLSATTDAGDGTYTATFTGTTAGSARAIGATIGGNAVTTPSPTITVTPGAASPVQSIVTVDSATLASGNGGLVRLVAHDAAGNTITTGGATVVFTFGGGSSTGTLSATTDVGDGTYTATFTGILAGTPRTIGATIGGVAVSTTLPTITVTPGALSLSTSTIALGTDTIQSGTDVGITLVTRDAAGNLRTTGGATVLFALGSGTSAGTIGTVTDQGNGTYAATFSGTIAGTPRAITATVGGQAITSASPTITVVAGDVSAATSTVEVGAASVASGTTTTLTLRVRDAAGNLLAAGGLAATFDKGAGTSDGTISAVTDHLDGSYTATFTGTVAGTARTIGATVAGVTVTSTLPTITVTPGALSRLQSTLAIRTATLASGDTATVTLTSRDSVGNAITTGGHTVALALGSGTSGGTLSAVTDAGDGTYRALFTATTVGTARAITATVDGDPLLSAGITVTVTPGPPSLTQSTVTVGTASIASGTGTTLTLTARDAAGNQLGGGATVVFTKGSGASDGNISAVIDNGNGTYTATFTGTTAGSARTIGATLDGAAVTSTLPTVMVTPGALSRAISDFVLRDDTLTAGDTMSIVLRARDAAGNLLGTGGATVVIAKGGTGTSDGTLGATTDRGDGTYAALFSGTLAGTARTFIATINGVADSIADPTLVVRPGAFSLNGSTFRAQRDTMRAGDTLVVTLTARDGFGNALGQGGLTVRWMPVLRGSTPVPASCASGPPLMQDLGDGTYRSLAAPIIQLYSVGLYDFWGWVQGQPGFDANCNVVRSDDSLRVRGGRGRAQFSSYTAAPQILDIGEVATLTATVKDEWDNATSGGDTVVFSKDDGTSNGVLGPTVDHGNGTYTATFTANTAGTPRLIGMTVNAEAMPGFVEKPALLVLTPAPDMALPQDSVKLSARVNTSSSPLLVAVANIGTGSVSGLATTSAHVSGPTGCSSVNWLGTPTFDMGGVAAPVSVMTLQANATGLPLGVCTRRLIVTSTTPGVAPETLFVSVDVGQAPVATGVVNVVMMGDANSNTVQTITPTPILTLDNGGRGTITNVAATIISQNGFAECTDPFDESTCVPWLTQSDLVLSSTTLPATLSIVSQVRPFSAGATIRVSGTGIASKDFNINVVFNVLPELVTNPRNIMLRGLNHEEQNQRAQFAYDTVIAFNQNQNHGILTNYRVDPTTVRDEWDVTVSPISGNRAQVAIRAGLSGFTNDTTITEASSWYYYPPNGDPPQLKTGGLRILADCVDPNDCWDYGVDSALPRVFVIPYTVTFAHGLTLPYRTLDVFATDTTTRVIDIPVTNLGPGALTNLQLAGNGNGSWLTWTLVGGATTTPATLRLTIRPALAPASPVSVFGSYLSALGAFDTPDGLYQYAYLTVNLHRRFK